MESHTKTMTAKNINQLEIPKEEQGVLGSILRLSGPGIKGLEAALSQIQPTLVNDRLIAQLKQNPDLAKVPDLDEILGTLVNIAGTAYSAGVSVNDLVDAAVTTIKNDDVVELSDQDAETLKERLKRLERLPPLELVAKGSQIVKASERTYLSAKVYSDLRPIFVGEETKIAGSIIVHQFAVRSLRNGRREYTYFMMDSSDLAELREVISRAISKDKALRELSACSNTPVLTPPSE